MAYIPYSVRCQVFSSLHYISHPGIKATAKLVSERFMWPAIRRLLHLGPSLPNPPVLQISRHIITQFGDYTSHLPTCYISTLTYSFLYRPQQNFNTTSRLWTALRAGHNPYLFLTPRQRQCHAPYSLSGYRTSVSIDHHNQPSTPV